MALNHNGNNESPRQIDDRTLSPIKNGNKNSPPQVNDGIVKVVVVGEPGCGKTTFIRQYYGRNYPNAIYSHNGVRVYPCQFGGFLRISIFEIPSDPGFVLEQRIPHYEKANVIVFMYAIDDPVSFEMLNEKWLLETINIIESKRKPVVFVGNKKDLRDDPQVIERLALENRSPVTLQEGSEMLDQVPGNVGIVECSAYNVNMVESAFHTILAYCSN